MASSSAYLSKSQLLIKKKYYLSSPYSSFFNIKSVPSSLLLFTVFDVRLSSCSSQRAPDFKLHLDTLLPLEPGFQRGVGNRFRLYDRYIRIVITGIVGKMDTSWFKGPVIWLMPWRGITHQQLDVQCRLMCSRLEPVCDRGRGPDDSHSRPHLVMQ
jgi:hypothetical protein